MFNHTKTSPMSQNMAEKRYGLAPLIDVDNCLPTKPDYTIDSWFVIGRVEEEDVKINYLFHIMAMNLPHPLPSRRKIWQVAYSIMNEADGLTFLETIFTRLQMPRLITNTSLSNYLMRKCQGLGIR